MSKEQGRVAEIQSYPGSVTDRLTGSGRGKAVRNTHRECVESTRRKQRQKNTDADYEIEGIMLSLS